MKPGDTTRDDDPDAPVTAGEAARAAGLARRIDELLAGAAAPPAMDADERTLLETAARVVASTHVVELPEDRQRRAIDAAFAAAVPRRAPSPTAEAFAAGPRGRIERASRALPWAVAGIAAAAAVALLVARPARRDDVAVRAPLPAAMRSRPSDPLIGPIPRRELADARVRLDVVFADRMAGYRALTLRGER